LGSKIQPQSTVGELVAERPSRAQVFTSHGIDFCCGGKRPLQEVCWEKGLSVETIIAELDAVDSVATGSEPDWTKSALSELVEHILNTYHAPLRKQLPDVLHLAQKVARVHGGRHPEMVEVARIFGAFKDELELHMQKEELILFPGIKRMETEGKPALFGCGGSIEHPIAMMSAEHDSAGDALKAMRELTNGFTPPADACNSFRVLLHSLAEIENEMHQHVHKENNILFPRALKLGCGAVKS
jgi:regulator of cell morphogenesis and NO signaling